MTRTSADSAVPVVVCDDPVFVVPCHGGAGATTLARLLGNTIDAGRQTPSAMQGRHLLLVARGTAFGGRMAIEATSYFQRYFDVVPAALAVVGDGPWPEPRSARARFRLLPPPIRVVRVPYIAQWRWLDDFADKPIPNNIVTSIRNLKKAIDDPS